MNCVEKEWSEMSLTVSGNHLTVGPYRNIQVLKYRQGHGKKCSGKAYWGSRNKTQKFLSKGRDIEAETERLCRGLLVDGNGEMRRSIPRRNKEEQAAVKSEGCSGNHSLGCPGGHRKQNVLVTISLTFISLACKRELRTIC